MRRYANLGHQSATGIFTRLGPAFRPYQSWLGPPRVPIRGPLDNGPYQVQQPSTQSEPALKNSPSLVIMEDQTRQPGSV